jgi:hypothetical protein
MKMNFDVVVDRLPEVSAKNILSQSGRTGLRAFPHTTTAGQTLTH